MGQGRKCNLCPGTVLDIWLAGFKEALGSKSWCPRKYGTLGLSWVAWVSEVLN